MYFLLDESEFQMSTSRKPVHVSIIILYFTNVSTGYVSTVFLRTRKVTFYTF